MAAVIDLNERRRRRERVFPRATEPRPVSIVTCAHCGERHPIVRLPGNERRCVTAFFDGLYWFCRNRGCRQAWLNDK
jgi:hypothetical protein